MKTRKTFTLLAAATASCLALLAAFVYTSALTITELEALPDQTTRRVFLRTGDSGWSNGAYMYSWGSETKTTAMTHVFDFGTNDSLYFVDIAISKVNGFLFLDGSAITDGAPNWDITNADDGKWLKSQDAPALPTWGEADVYTLKGIWGNNPGFQDSRSLALSADQLATLLKRYTSCSSDARLYTDSCLAYPQLQANFNIDSFANNTTTDVPAFAGGEKTGVKLGAKVKMMKHQYQHWDVNPPEEDVPVVLPKTEIKQTYADLIENSCYDLDGAPTVGECKLLVIPVWFTDSSSYVSTSKKANVKADIQKAYFGTQEETGWHSVKSYYETESSGKLSISGVVSDWYSPGISMADAGQYSGMDTASLAQSAANWYFTNNPSQSRADFDCDDNGYLDGVLLIYAAPDYMTLGNQNYDNLWAYCFWAQDTSVNSVTSPGMNVFFWASYDFIYGSNTVSSRTGKSYYRGDTRYCTIDAHTLIHEMGHVFGIPDYYDYGSNSYSPAGDFSMQDYNVGGHDPYSTMAFGWSDPYIPTESCQIQIGAFQTTREFVLLTPSWNTYDSPFDEYLLLELYTPTGLNAFDSAHQYLDAYPQGPSQTGIRLWHVDSRLQYFSGSWNYSINNLTTDAHHYSKYHGVDLAFSNTYDGDHMTPLGSSYADYNVLQLIRNNTSETYRPTSSLSNASLFGDGSSFDMSTYRSQFVKSTLLNNGKTLGWSFSVAIEGSGANATATINLVRA